MRTAKYLVKCTIADCGVKIDLPLSFQTSIEVMAVCAGKKVSLFEIKLVQMGCPRTGDLLVGQLGEKRKVMDLQRPSKKMQTQLSSSSNSSENSDISLPPATATATCSVAAEKVDTPTPSTSTTTETDTDETDDVADAHLIEGVSCLLEEAEESGCNLDDVIEESAARQTGMTADEMNVAAMFQAAGRFVSFDEQFQEENEGQVESTSADVKPIEEAVSQVEHLKLKAAVEANKSLASTQTTEEIEKAASGIQQEQNIIPEDALLEATLNDSRIAGNTVYESADESSDSSWSNIKLLFVVLSRLECHEAKARINWSCFMSSLGNF